MDHLRDRRVYMMIVGVFILLLLWSMSAPRNFPTGEYISIPDGLGVQQISKLLEEEQVIRSPFWFRTFAILFGGERKMKAGEYYFNKHQSASLVAWRITHGDYQVETRKITILEGSTIEEVSAKFGGDFTHFNNLVFESEAREGYLFPDTYFVPLTATATGTLKMLQNNFEEKTRSLLGEIARRKLTMDEIVTMASLIEAEANKQEDREIISGILWKRLKIDMPLQVDVERATYEFKGLPKKPINNPGLLSITAAVYPKSSPYLYYITGKDGKMRYARDFDEHRDNIAKYLR